MTSSKIKASTKEMKLVLGLVILVIIIIVVLIVWLIYREARRKQDNNLSSSSESSSRSKSAEKVELLRRYPVRSSFNPPIPDEAIDLFPRMDGTTSKYAIALPPPLEDYRSRIFRLHIEDIRIPDDLKTDPVYPKVVAALRTYNRAPTIEELKFLVKYKNFLDMPGVYSMCTPREIDQLYLTLLNVVVNKVPGDFIETGVWKGGMGLFAKAVFNYYSVSNPIPRDNRIIDTLPRRVLLFDAFDQFPAPEAVPIVLNSEQTALNQKDASVHSITRMMYDRPANAIEVRDAFQSFGLLDDNVSIVKGLFSQTIPAAFNSGLILDSDQIAVLRIDNDYYDSVYFVLNQLYFKVSPGGYVIIDDYNNPVIGCKEAVHRFRDENGITKPIVDSYGGSVYWQV